MLKWIAPKGNQPRSSSNGPTASNNNKTSNSSSPRLTDDPLATIDVDAIAPDTKRIPAKASKRRFEPEQVYSVTRINPLFVESVDMLASSNLTEGEKRLMDDSHSSNRSEQCRTPSSSGYESALGVEKRQGNTFSNNEINRQAIQIGHRHHGHHQQHLVELSPASDYRRQFVLGPRLDRSPPTRVSTNVANDVVPRRIGKANLLRQNAMYVTDIHISNKRNNEHDLRQKIEWDDENPQDRAVPHPVWPSNVIRDDERSSQSKTIAIVKQNENYVTKIMISPRFVASSAEPVVEEQPDDQEVYDSIVTHSLLMMTSYDDCQKSSDGQPEDNNDETAPVELADIRKLSQTLSKRRVVATVSRALSKSSGSSSTSGSETSSMHPTSRDPEGKHIPTFGDSIAKRISLMRERWEKSSRRQLLVESDEDDPTLYRGLDHLYIPQNGDGNYSAAGQLLYRANSDRNVSKEYAGSSPFSYLAGVHQTTILEEPVADGRLPNRPVYGDSFEHDRLSNSSSRSSGSRRVTFSADTVDNEQSTRGSSSSNSSGSSSGNINDGERYKKRRHPQPIAQELKLNPQYLPHRYQQSKSDNTACSERNRPAGYYSSNLQTHNELFDNANKRSAEKVSAWEHYHEAGIKTLSTKSTSDGLASAGASIIQMEPHGNLQLHPNYGSACQDRPFCVDFTLDGGEVSLLQRRSHSDKLRRRLCCCVLLLLCLAVLVVVVIGISLYLSSGKKIFGSLGSL